MELLEDVRFETLHLLRGWLASELRKLESNFLQISYTKLFASIKFNYCRSNPADSILIRLNFWFFVSEKF